MSKPTKIPVSYAYSYIRTNKRGFPYVIDDIGETQFDEYKDTGLIPITRLKQFFKHPDDYKQFKANLNIPDAYWNVTIKNNPEHANYVKRFMKNKPKSATTNKRGRPTTKKRNKVNFKLGQYSDSEMSDSDASYVSIIPSGDECDDQDVNFPRESCKGIRRMCHKYDKQRRYLPYDKNETTNNPYHFAVSYK